MRLLFKFNLVFVVVFALGMAASAYVSRELLQRNAQEEIVEHARLIMEKAIAVRTYTSNQIRPLLDTQMKYAFLPQSVPSYSAQEVLADLRKKYPDYNYKEATLNPTNPKDRAVEWEADVITQFRNFASQTEITGQRDTPNGKSLYIARPLRITNPACLTCHSTVEAAPKPMIDKYGTANGFGWNLNEVVGAQVVSVPMAVPLARADKTFSVFMISLTAIFLAVGVVLNLMLYALVIRPVSQLSKLADRVSLGELDAPEFKRTSRDEIGKLSESFARMRSSLTHAMQMLEG